MMTNDRSKNFGHVEMSNGPSFNTRTPWTVDPTEADYEMADGFEEIWIRDEIRKRNLPFTIHGIESYVSRNVHLLTGEAAVTAIQTVKNPDATLYDLFHVANRIHKTMMEVA